MGAPTAGAEQVTGWMNKSSLKSSLSSYLPGDPHPSDQSDSPDPALQGAQGGAEAYSAREYELPGYYCKPAPIL